MESYKEIHIGEKIKYMVEFSDIDINRICNFFNCSIQDVSEMYTQKTIDTDLLLRWCKLIEYNFFMFYHSHLQLYSPKSATCSLPKAKNKPSKAYQFRKNIYTVEIQEFIMSRYTKGEMSSAEIIEHYQIPRTTFYRWLKKSKMGESKPKKTKNNSKQLKVIGYKNIYTDLIYESNYLNPKNIEAVKDQISKINSFSDVLRLNEVIRGKNTTVNSVKLNQQLKSYDKDLIFKILKEQQNSGLSNQDIALKYKMSRNTIAKWKNVFSKELQS